jgi:hypothetical protein
MAENPLACRCDVPFRGLSRQRPRLSGTPHETVVLRWVSADGERQPYFRILCLPAAHSSTNFQRAFRRPLGGGNADRLAAGTAARC